MEKWAPVNWIDGVLPYSVSDHGRVRRDCRLYGMRAEISAPGYVLKQKRTANGYWSVGLQNPEKRKQRHVHVHRLVAIAFLGPPPDGMNVNHKDGDKGNNLLSNIEYLSFSDNVAHAYINGKAKAKRGEDHVLSVLNKDAVLGMRVLYEEHGWTIAALARAFRTDTARVTRIVRYEIWIANGADTVAPT